MEQEGTGSKPAEKYCENSAASIDARAVIYPKCGVPIGPYKKLLETREHASDRFRLVALLFAWFFGMLGIH